ncbi:uncharacterized protein LOC126735096 [Anthonomus grandis grandis]|uniref:uncharacterized protein LOC126735096 n=1 Tax=Anthonomus grandis grandis TaxID=2921223 RepID=UPI0021651395|nr:uncharacterized protein LOC126735096 [Anthonomus grandis grandis]
MLEISKLSIIKFFELGLAAVCLGFHYRSQTYSFDCDTVSVAAFGGFTIITAGSLMGYLMESPINRKVEVFFCLVGCSLFAAAGTLNLIFFEKYSKSEWKNYGLTKGILAVVDAALFLINSVLTWREL